MTTPPRNEAGSFASSRWAGRGEDDCDDDDDDGDSDDGEQRDARRRRGGASGGGRRKSSGGGSSRSRKGMSRGGETTSRESSSSTTTTTTAVAMSHCDLASMRDALDRASDLLNDGGRRDDDDDDDIARMRKAGTIDDSRIDARPLPPSPSRRRADDERIARMREYRDLVMEFHEEQLHHGDIDSEEYVSRSDVSWLLKELKWRYDDILDGMEGWVGGNERSSSYDDDDWGGNRNTELRECLASLANIVRRTMIDSSPPLARRNDNPFIDAADAGNAILSTTARSKDRRRRRLPSSFAT